jgi:YHS domain-containing protein
MEKKTSGISRRTWLIGGFSLLLAASSGLAIGYGIEDADTATEVEINTLSSDVAIKGHDPVAYFLDGIPVMGDPAYQAEHGGALYQFASADNLMRFQQEPEAYVPAYGGYCSYGVRLGMKYDIDPTAFEIVDGRLYLQLDPGTRHVWLQDTYENIMIADQIWREISPIDPGRLPLSM